MSSNEVVRIPNGLKNTGIFHFLSTVISNECISYLAIVFWDHIMTCLHISKENDENHSLRTKLIIRKHVENLTLTLLS